MTQFSTAFEAEGLVELRKEFEQLMTTNPEMEKKLRDLIKKVMQTARAQMSEEARKVLPSDPRQAYRAVRYSVYRQILGGNINILAKRRAGARKDYTPTRTLRSGQWGGNRRPRSSRTRDLESYYGSDRGFILRFINAGTQSRGINFTYDGSREQVHRGSHGGHRYGKTINTGNRGRIAPRNFFSTASQRVMEKAAQSLSQIIDKTIAETLK